MYLLRHIFSSYLAIVCDIDLGVMPPLPPPPPPRLPTTAEEHRKEIYFNTTWEFYMHSFLWLNCGGGYSVLRL